MALKKGFLGGTAFEEPDINLVPVMDLLTALITFLLTTTSFYSISVINASVPTVSDEIDLDQPSMKVTLTLQMDERGFGLSAMSDDGRITRQELAAINMTIPKKQDAFDYEKLSQTLYNIKRKYPKSETMIFIPNRELSYEEMIKAMDASREIVTAYFKGTAQKKQLLFPNVVVSSTVE